MYQFIKDPFRPSENASPRIAIRRLDEVLVGSQFTYQNQIWVKYEGGCRRAKGRAPQALIALPGDLTVLGTR